MRDMEQRVDNTLRDLDEQIANADTPAEKRELQAIKREVQSEWDNLQENPPPVITQRGVADGASLAKFQGEWDNRLDQMRDKLDQADSALGTPARAASSGARLASFEPLPSSVFDAVSDVADHIKDMGFLGKISDIVDRLTTPSSGSNATSNTTGTSSTEQSSNTEGSSSTEGSSETSKTERSGSTNRSSGSFIGNQEFGGKTVDEMMQMASDNPEALAEHMDGLGTEEKQKAMQAMMKRMQEINQMFTMLSNIMKSMHDTAKAAINNMRV